MALTDVLGAHVGPVPVWLIVGAGAVAVAVFAPKLFNKSASTLTGSNTSGAAVMDSNVDPTTGIPYQIEQQSNPQTGLPNYYNQPGFGLPTNYGAPPSATPAATTDPYAAQKTNAINQWEAHTGHVWNGPPGSYPAGWIAPDVPGAYSNGVYKVPPTNPSGMGLPPTNRSLRWPHMTAYRR
jgi:hypothetical protein